MILRSASRLSVAVVVNEVESLQLTLCGCKTLEYENIRFWVSDCHPAAIQLIRSGLFPCAPKYPSLAVDIRTLDFVTRLFLRISPNYTAWCNTWEDYLYNQGYRLEGKDPLRRRFRNTLQWFNSLQAACERHVNDVLADSRLAIECEEEHFPSQEQVPAPIHSRRPSVTVEDVEDEETIRIRKNQVPMSEIDIEFTDQNTPNKDFTRKRHHSHEDHFQPIAQSRPSEYLRSRCPICFGGEFDVDKDRLTWADIIVCLDVCFTQRHNAQPRDPTRKHPDSFFIPQEEVNAVQARVDASQSKTRPNKRPRMGADNEDEDDHLEPGMMISKAILNSCGGSFKAAQEFLAKVIPKGSDVTGVMALLCRHDRPLWVVNMTTPGECQHYAIALLEKLFQHIPSFLHVGLLYDIGCQLERSCLKWGLLEDHIDNLVFAISIFHAFGHQWACQLIYHPRKCERFGLSDGEGAERLWHSIQHLIAYTHIAGYHLRLYTLDAQFHFGNNENLLRMGQWIARKYCLLESKRCENEKELAESGIPIKTLREQWKNQVEMQTHPLPAQSKNKGKQAVQECMRLRQSKKTLEKRLKYLQDITCDPDSADYDVATAEVELPQTLDRLKTTREKLAKKEQALGANEKTQLHHWVKSQYVTKSMNARAILTRLRERL
ncbi:hypothetical protein VKT23_009503 [Stygiomarasmius scandens]|uniref:CxC2-like cysteine cluster KDZ transposase-associated domain-containing protein n=1 Tax=Marasmiellus scandens TaxID=2682957 RepID=A0ABR1JGI4_9AGAR